MRKRWLALGGIGIAVVAGSLLLRESERLELDPPRREAASAPAPTAEAAPAGERGDDPRSAASPTRASESASRSERQPHERRALFGRVRDLHGNPIAGATVVLTQRNHLGFSGSATTDSTGRYRIERWPSELEMLDLRAEFGPRLRVTADSFVPLELSVGAEIPIELPGDPELDVWLSRGARLVGCVTDLKNGAPIEGARVELRSGEGYPIRPQVLQRTSTASDGRFAFEAIPSRSIHASTYAVSLPPRPAVAALIAAAPGFATSTTLVDAADEGDTVELDVALVRCGRIRGRVVDLEARPHEGVRVGLIGPTAGSLGERGEHVRPYATTGEDGSYALDDAPLAGSLDGYLLRAWTELSPGFTAAESEPIRIAVEPGATVDAPDLVVPRLLSIVVRVSDVEGRPIAGASATGNAGNQARTDAEGRAIVRSREPMRQRIRADADGFLSRLSDPVEPRAFDPPEIAIRLPRARAIRGRVRSADGSPARVAVVAIDGSIKEAVAKEALASRSLSSYSMRWSVDDTRPGGWFVLEGLPDALCHVVAVGYGSGPPAPARILAFLPNVDVEGPPLEIELAEAWPADRSATPAGSVTVRVRDGDRPAIALESLVLIARSGEERGGRTDAPGRVRFDRVPLGAWTLVGRVPDRAPFEVDLTVDESEPHRELTVELTGAARLAGRIRDVAAMTALRAYVQAVGPDATAIEGRTAADGAFVVPDLKPDAAYRLELRTLEPHGRMQYWTPSESEPVVATRGAADLGSVAFVRGVLVRFELPGRSSRLIDGQLEIVAEGRRLALSPRLMPVSLVLPKGSIAAMLTCSEGTFEASTSADVVDETTVRFTGEE